MSAKRIREIEYGVLDQEHKRYEFLRLPEDLAITRLLKVKGDIGRTFVGAGVSHIPELSLHAFASGLSRALSHCLRWVCTNCQPGEATHGPNWRQEDDQALAFLGWGMRYARIATDHVAWSNGLVDAAIDEETKTIEFGPPRDMDVGYYKRQVQADLDWWNLEIGERFPKEAFVQLFNDWQFHAEWKPQGLEFSPDFVRRHPRFAEMRDWMAHRLFAELAENCWLGSYNVGQLRTFFATLHTVCECIRTLEDEVDARVGREGMGTWTFQLPRRAFIEWLVHATGLGNTVADCIVADMTLNPNRFHCSITATPFVLSQRKTLFLLPRLFSLLSPHRSFATALTTGSGRQAYERIANALERFHVDRISKALEGCGLNVLCEKTFNTPGGEKLTPDFVIADRSSADVVVTDFKNALAATAVSEVTNRLREYTEGISQVERYVDRFSRFPELLNATWGPTRSPRKIMGLLLFRVPMPLPVARSPLVEVDDWCSILRRLGSLVNARVCDVLPPSAQIQPQDVPEIRVQETKVGEWTYRHSVLFWPSPTPLLVE